MEKKLFWTFYEKVLQKAKAKKFRTEKVITKKAINYMLNGKDKIIRLTVGLIRKRNSINMLIFSKTKIFRGKCKSWVRFI